MGLALHALTENMQLTVRCTSTHPVTVRSLPSLRHAHHPNVVGGASLQCSQDGRCTIDSPHLQGPFWRGVHLPWLSGVLDSVGHSSPSKSLPCNFQSWRSFIHTRSDTDTHHLAGWLAEGAWAIVGSCGNAEGSICGSFEGSIECLRFGEVLVGGLFEDTVEVVVGWSVEREIVLLWLAFVEVEGVKLVASSAQLLGGPAQKEYSHHDVLFASIFLVYS